jgi:hypothetical protein
MHNKQVVYTSASLGVLLVLVFGLLYESAQPGEPEPDQLRLQPQARAPLSPSPTPAAQPAEPEEETAEAPAETPDGDQVAEAPPAPAPDPEPQWHFPRNVTDERPAPSPYPRRRTTSRDPGLVLAGFPADDDLDLDQPDGPILQKQAGYSGG